MFIPYLKFEFARMIGSRNAVRGVAITICILFAASPIAVQAQQQGAGDKATSAAVTSAPVSSPSMTPPTPLPHSMNARQ